MLTRSVTPAPGSAIDPRVDEVTWQAVEMKAFDPGRVTQGSMQSANMGFDCLTETIHLPGRAVAISELRWTPDESEGGQVTARMAVGVFGPKGSTAHEALGVTPRFASAVGGGGLFHAEPCDPAVVVPGDVAVWPETDRFSAHLVQSRWAVGDDDDLVEIVSRFNPTMEPWAGLVDQITQLEQPLRVRATVLATELSPADRLEIDRDLDRLRSIRSRNNGRLEVEFDVDRAEATLLDVRASFASPVLVCEIAISSPEPLSETLLRSLAASFTSETDVLRQQGRIVVASNRLVLGGFEIQRDPKGWQDAQRVGVPLRGGLRPRQLRDLVTLTESPIGWPIPAGRSIPSIAAQLPVIRTVPAALSAAAAPDSPLSDRTAIGRSLSGTDIVLPVNIRTRHVVATGSWGAGKSTHLYTLALDDLRRGRSLVMVDPHGTSASKLIPWAQHLGLDPVIIDPRDGSTERLQVLPPFGSSAPRRAAAEASIGRFSEATASYQPDRSWTGPRWYTTFGSAMELVWVHGGEVADAVVWLNDVEQLRRRLQHDDLSPMSRANLRSVATGGDNAVDLCNWVTAKLHPLTSSEVRRILAPVGKGTDLGTALAAGRPVIVNLASLSTSEAAMVSHLVTSTVLDWAFGRPHGDRSLVTLYLDELQRAPERGIGRILAEGRKFGIALVAATQSLGQLSAELADLAMAAGTQVTFRATPDTAARMAPILDVTARELMALPDLHAVVKVQGHPSASVIVPAYEECPVDRVVTPPKAPRRRKPRDTPKPLAVVASTPAEPRPSRLRPTGTDGSNSTLIDDFLAFRASANADES